MARPALRKIFHNSASLYHGLFRITPPPPHLASSISRHFSPAKFPVFPHLLPPRSLGNPFRTLSSLASDPKKLKASHGRRLYYTDARGYQHFGGRGLAGLLRTPHGQKKARQYVIIFLALGGVFLGVYATHLEVVPYTYRRHFVLITPQWETKLVENQFEALKKEWKPLILPPIHPQAIRVRKIAKDIIQAVMEGAKENDSSALQYNDDKRLFLGEHEKDAVVWRDAKDLPSSPQWEANDEVLDDRWIEESRQKGLKQGVKPFVEHLKLMKWEVLVIDKDITNAFCLPGGKIVVFTGLLKRFPSDAAIATVLGHEVAHVVARHGAERLTRNLFLTVMELFVLTFFYAPDLVRSVSTLFLELPFSRSQELEADRIGLLLMAAAEYDPRVAPAFYEKLGELSGASDLLQYVTTHPSGKKRGERLKKTGAMEQALKIYFEKTQGKAADGFL